MSPEGQIHSLSSVPKKSSHEPPLLLQGFPRPAQTWYPGPDDNSALRKL